MKKRFLIVILCLACVASFAQTKKKKSTAKKPVKKAVAARQSPLTGRWMVIIKRPILKMVK
jgi:hypothetical protein